MEWQPIETAPKDGTYFLGIYFGWGEWNYGLIHWDGKSFEDRDDYTWDDVTHWMLLPEPPPL